MRTPRWLTVATISLSIIFILWLCLVIPNNAPKQKVKKEKVRMKGLVFFAKDKIRSQQHRDLILHLKLDQ
jgi:hypothetical protein